MSDETRCERRGMIFSITLTLVFIPILIGFYVRGPEEALLVASLGFLVGYIFERVRLYRRIVTLQQRSITS